MGSGRGFDTRTICKLFFWCYVPCVVYSTHRWVVLCYLLRCTHWIILCASTISSLSVLSELDGQANPILHRTCPYWRLTKIGNDKRFHRTPWRFRHSYFIRTRFTHIGGIKFETETTMRHAGVLDTGSTNSFYTPPCRISLHGSLESNMPYLTRRRIDTHFHDLADRYQIHRQYDWSHRANYTSKDSIITNRLYYLLGVPIAVTNFIDIADFIDAIRWLDSFRSSNKLWVLEATKLQDMSCRGYRVGYLQNTLENLLFCCICRAICVTPSYHYVYP